MTESQWLASTDPAEMLRFLNKEPGTPTNPFRMALADRQLRLFACACCRQVWHLLTDERSRRAVEVAERYADGEATEDERRQAMDNLPKANQKGFVPSGQIAVNCVFPNGWDQWRVLTELLGHEESGGTCGGQGLEDLDKPAMLSYAIQAALLRCIVGNPYRPALAWSSFNCPKCGKRGIRRRGAQFDHEFRCGECKVSWEPEKRESPLQGWLRWDNGTIPKLAEAAYQDRLSDGSLCPARLGIIADALQEAGCADEAILGHLRGLEPCTCGGMVDCSLCDCTGWRPLRGPHVRGCWVVDMFLDHGNLVSESGQ